MPHRSRQTEPWQTDGAERIGELAAMVQIVLDHVPDDPAASDLVRPVVEDRA